MIYVFFIVFGLAPSIIWLLFYLKKDAHPESKIMVLKIFLYGALIVILAAAVETGLSMGLVFFLEKQIESFSFLSFLLYHFIIIAFVEEFFKYLVVREKVINNKEFDEPVDAMIYMIIAALGFAALENVLILFSAGQPYILKEALLVSSFRFLGATFLHALASGVVGYFLAMSFYQPAKRFFLIAKGLMIGAILHGIFNISIMEIEKGLVNENMFLFISAFVFLVIFLTGLGFFVSSRFKKLKKLNSTCNTMPIYK